MHANPKLSFETITISEAFPATVPKYSMVIVDKIYKEVKTETVSKKCISIVTISDVIEDYSGAPYTYYLSSLNLISGLFLAHEEFNTVAREREIISHPSQINLNYIAVAIEKIKCQKEFPCNLYIRLGEEKFVKFFNKTEDLSKEILEKFAKKKVEKVYIEKSSFYSFTKEIFVGSVTNEKLNHFEASYISSYMDTIYDMAKSVGISESIISSVNETYENITDKAPDKVVKSLILQFKKLKGTFLFDHSYLLGIVSTAIGLKYSWMSHENREKIFLASVLHDLGHIDAKNASYDSFTKSEILKIDPLIKSDVLNHVDAIVNKLKENNNVSDDVISMIYYHHGALGGESYPKTSHATEMNLITAHFAISHALVIGLFKIEFSRELMPKLIDEIEQKYNKGNIRKIMPAFIAETKSILLGK